VGATEKNKVLLASPHCLVGERSKKCAKTRDNTQNEAITLERDKVGNALPGSVRSKKRVGERRRQCNRERKGDAKVRFRLGTDLGEIGGGRMKLPPADLRGEGGWFRTAREKKRMSRAGKSRVPAKRKEEEEPSRSLDQKAKGQSCYFVKARRGGIKVA